MPNCVWFAWPKAVRLLLLVWEEVAYRFIRAVVIDVDVAVKLCWRPDLDDEIFVTKIEREIALFVQACCQSKSLIFIALLLPLTKYVRGRGVSRLRLMV